METIKIGNLKVSNIGSYIAHYSRPMKKPYKLKKNPHYHNSPNHFSKLTMIIHFSVKLIKPQQHSILYVIKLSMNFLPH